MTSRGIMARPFRMCDFVFILASFFIYISGTTIASAQVQPGVYSFAGAPANGAPQMVRRNS